MERSSDTSYIYEYYLSVNNFTQMSHSFNELYKWAHEKRPGAGELGWWVAEDRWRLRAFFEVVPYLVLYLWDYCLILTLHYR